MQKDRQNWAGKVPKRQLFHGPVSAFDWIGELRKIREAREAELERSTSGASMHVLTGSSDAESVCELSEPETKPENKSAAAPSTSKRSGLDFLKTCFACKVAVWVGPVQQAPAGVCLACPEDCDWEQANNAPFCDTCWAEESEFLGNLASSHRVRALDPPPSHQLTPPPTAPGQR